QPPDSSKHTLPALCLSGSSALELRRKVTVLMGSSGKAAVNCHTSGFHEQNTLNLLIKKKKRIESFTYSCIYYKVL
uniref:Uncharacterized protein n=1 Tax=Denticeps clupeoides TaxID=299321 RepID=A0AAY4CWF4_9TELE